MDVLRQDLRFAFRMLRASPAFALTAIVAFALGIGANSAIFSLVYGILVQPLPFPDPDRLVMVWEKNPRGIDRNSVSPPNFTDYRTRSTVFSAMAAFYEVSANLDSNPPEHLMSSMVTPDFFKALDVRPTLGAGIGEQSGPPGADVLLSYGLWQRRFGKDPTVEGRTLRIDDANYTIRGVMPESFRFPSSEVALWTTMPPNYLRAGRQAHFLSTVARLKADTSLSRARAELGALGADLARLYPASNRGWGVTIVPLKDQITGDIRASLVVLLGAVGFVLLIACANIANLLLARSTHRQGEISIRMALGASARRIRRQMLTESVLLGFLGGVAGLALCWSGLQVLKGIRPVAIPRLNEIGINGWVILFTFLIAFLAGAASGLAPALRVSRANPHEGLKEGMANRRSFAGQRLRGVLIISEVALSMLLLIGAGLLIRTFVRVQQLDPGFNPEGCFTVTVDLPQSRYSNAQLRAAFLQTALARVSALPGVDSAGMISSLPLTGGEGYNRFGFTIEGKENTATAEGHRFYARWITPGYFSSMGIPLVRGRDFTDRDRAGSAPTVIIDATLARRYFPNENPVGKFLRLSYARSIPREIIGVAGEVRLVALEMEPAPQVYIPVLQEAQLSTISLVVRGAMDRLPAGEAVRQEIYRIDKNLPVYDVRWLTDRVAASIAPRRFNMLLMGLLAALALVLAAVGVYGVIAFMVGERMREIGIRVALGARPVKILLLVLGQGMTQAAIGIASGMAAAIPLTKAMRGLLYGISPVDVWTFGAVAPLTALVALLACLVPALRAARLDTVEALRSA